jgi:hypothetical protein
MLDILKPLPVLSRYPPPLSRLHPPLNRTVPQDGTRHQLVSHNGQRLDQQQQETAMAN